MSLLNLQYMSGKITYVPMLIPMPNPTTKHSMQLWARWVTVTFLYVAVIISCNLLQHHTKGLFI